MTITYVIIQLVILQLDSQSFLSTYINDYVAFIDLEFTQSDIEPLELIHKLSTIIATTTKSERERE